MFGMGISRTRPAALSFPLSISSQLNFKNPKNLDLRASLSNPNFPHASKIMVRNLGYSISESSLRKEFSNFGEVADVKLVKEETARRPKVHAFIQYTCQDDAILALENMDQKMFDGRLIYVELAKPRKDSFGGYPKTCGPPKRQHLKELQQDEVADCWY